MPNNARDEIGQWEERISAELGLKHAGPTATRIALDRLTEAARNSASIGLVEATTALLRIKAIARPGTDIHAIAANAVLEISEARHPEDS